MFATPKSYDLTAVNAAIEALSYAQTDVTLETDSAIFEAVDLLLAIRRQLTDKPFPENRPLKSANRADFEFWHQCRAAEQQVEGLQ
jgi:ribonuclease HI